MDRAFGKIPPDRRRFDLRTRLGLAFVVLGVLALVVPALATTAIVVLLAVAMVFWGSLGAAVSYASPSFPDWKIATFGFALVAVVGAVFLAFPGLGAEILTMLVVAALLLEGIYSLLLAVSLRGGRQGWHWMAASGVVALVIGFLILLGWPGTAGWLLGLGLGLNFASTGIALILLGRTSRSP